LPESKVDYNSLLEGWYLERKQQLDKSLVATVRNGDMVNGKGRVQTFLRDWGLRMLQLVPTWKHWIERGPRNDSRTRYIHSPGMPFIPELGGGEYFPQVYCIGLQRDSVVQFTDDAIFAGKKEPFQIVVLLDSPSELNAAIRDLDGINQYKGLSQDEATFFVPRAQCTEVIDQGPRDQYQRPLFRTASGDEFSQSPLCTSRPAPYGYDESLLFTAGKRYVVLRFDRFVYALCDTKADLEKAAAQISEML